MQCAVLSMRQQAAQEQAVAAAQRQDSRERQGRPRVHTRGHCKGCTEWCRDEATSDRIRDVFTTSREKREPKTKGGEKGLTAADEG